MSDTLERLRVMLDRMPDHQLVSIKPAQLRALLDVAEVLSVVLPEEEPLDIDQDCIYCRGHYHVHEPDCAWLRGRAALASLDSTGGAER